MLITTKQKGIGYAFIVAAFLLFGGYWWFLLEPYQSELLSFGRKPTLIGTLLGSFLIGSAIAFFAQMGLIFIGVARKGLEFTFSNLFESKDFWTWMLWVNAVVLFFSLMWKYGNF